MRKELTMKLILVAMDGSEGAARTIDYAAHQANNSGAEPSSEKAGQITNTKRTFCSLAMSMQGRRAELRTSHERFA